MQANFKMISEKVIVFISGQTTDVLKAGGTKISSMDSVFIGLRRRQSPSMEFGKWVKE